MSKNLSLLKQNFSHILTNRFWSSEKELDSSELSSEEHNALRYVTGYIPHNLKKKYGVETTPLK